MKTFILNGTRTYRDLLDNLALLDDHCYNIDELFLMYRDWCRRGDLFVKEQANLLFGKIEEGDDYKIFSNALCSLYRSIDSLTPGLDRRKVYHTAYCPDEGIIILETRQS